MSMKTIVITSTSELWKKAQKEGKYAYSTIDMTLDEVGFIHATSPDQTIALLNRRFGDRDDILLLLVDLNKVQSEVKFEPTLSGTPGLFPHLYGPLNLDAIYGNVTPSKDSVGSFITPEKLARLVA